MSQDLHNQSANDQSQPTIDLLAWKQAVEHTLQTQESELRTLRAALAPQPAAPPRRQRAALLGRALTSRVGRGLLAASLLTMALGSDALASVPDAGGVIHGCLSQLTSAGSTQPPPGYLTLTVLDPDKISTCPGNRPPISWNQTGVMGPKGDTGAIGPSGILASSFMEQFSSSPQATLGFIASPTTVAVGTGQRVFVISVASMEVTAAGGRLQLSICSQPSGGGEIISVAPFDPQVIDGNPGLLSQYGLNADLAGLSAGSYKVGLCGTGTGSWSSLARSYTTALVHN